jgi:hypothetical protein
MERVAMNQRNPEKSSIPATTSERAVCTRFVLLVMLLAATVSSGCSILFTSAASRHHRDHQLDTSDLASLPFGTDLTVKLSDGQWLTGEFGGIRETKSDESPDRDPVILSEPDIHKSALDASENLRIWSGIVDSRWLALSLIRSDSRRQSPLSTNIVHRVYVRDKSRRAAMASAFLGGLAIDAVIVYTVVNALQNSFGGSPMGGGIEWSCDY